MSGIFEKLVDCRKDGSKHRTGAIPYLTLSIGSEDGLEQERRNGKLPGRDFSEL
jgi:hypothetical protein